MKKRATKSVILMQQRVFLKVMATAMVSAIMIIAIVIQSTSTGTIATDTLAMDVTDITLVILAIDFPMVTTTFTAMQVMNTTVTD